MHLLIESRNVRQFCNWRMYDREAACECSNTRLKAPVPTLYMAHKICDKNHSKSWSRITDRTFNSLK